MDNIEFSDEEQGKFVMALKDVICMASAFAHKGMAYSAQLCLDDAIACRAKSDFVNARERALRSLAFSVGQRHPAYLAAEDTAHD